MMKFLGNRSVCAFLLCLSGIGFAQADITSDKKTQLIAPWYFLYAQISATLGKDPCVTVGNLVGEGPNMEININVCDYNKAEALSAFIIKQHDFGNLKQHDFGSLMVTVNVLAPDSVPVSAQAPNDSKQAAAMLNLALTGNPYFAKAGSVGKAAFIEFKPLVVQFFSDNISDFYSNTNMVASWAFDDIMTFNSFSPKSVKIYATTAPLKKLNQVLTER